MKRKIYKGEETEKELSLKIEVNFVKRKQSCIFSKKAQGALEFLMTYGWAFLVILIMIGALAYFGVLSPTKFLPERCIFGSQFLCKDYLLKVDTTTGTADITAKLQNNLGQAVYIMTTSTASSPEGFNSDAGCVITLYGSDGATDIGEDGAGSGTAVADGAYFTFSATGCTSLGGMTEGTKYKVAVNIIYYAATSDSTFSHTIQGEVFANVESA